MAELERGSVGVNTIFIWSWSLKFLYNSVVHQSIFWAIQQTLLSATNRWISVLHACLIWNICILIVLHYYIPEKASSEEWFLCEHVKDWKEFENEWVWRDFLIDFHYNHYTTKLQRNSNNLKSFYAIWQMNNTSTVDRMWNISKFDAESSSD